jgi:Zn-dependent protease with chaperone function
MKNYEIQLSKEFKSQTTKAVFAVFLFIFTYFLILLFSILLAFCCIVGSVFMVLSYPHFVIAAIGLGLSSLGILVLIFLLKFIVKSHKTDRSHLVEITAATQPKIFEMINEIVQKVGTSYPKKVYLSSDVNASVFYDSNFWSMFFPVKKNLQIGLGLINSVSEEELKAILSHEFGHFAQRSMKVGSYVYNVNQVIFNLLYDNDSYENLIQKLGNLSGYFSIFVFFAVKINAAIQWLLKKMYDFVNKSYYALSREMEFHADEIAANVTGFEPLKNSLMRLSLADFSLTSVIRFYNERITENIKSENLYKEQSFVIGFLSNLNGFTLVDTFPKISLDDQNKFDKSKLVIKDQWASHPTLEERIERLENTKISNPDYSFTPANLLLNDSENLQRIFTDKAFELVEYQEEVVNNSLGKFENEYVKELDSNSFSKIYNGYYDNKNPLIFDLDKPQNLCVIEFSELFSDTVIDLVYNITALKSDIETLVGISDNTYQIKTFDYEGVRYKQKDALALSEKLAIELETLEKHILENDIKIYAFFEDLEKKENKPGLLKAMYHDFFQTDKAYDSKFKIYQDIINSLNFVNVVTPFDQIRRNLSEIEDLEDKLKNEINLIFSDEIFKTEISKDIKSNLDKYLSQNWEYFDEPSYIDDNLNLLYAAINNYAFLLSRGYFLKKKKILIYQEELLAV